MNKIQIPVLLLFIMAACVTGQRAFNRGDYYDATLKAVKNLRTNPNSGKSLDLVMKSYPLALDYYRQQVDQLTRSNDPNRFLKTVGAYEKLNYLADEITRCPPALDKLRPVVYFHRQLAEAQRLAIAEQMESAIALVETGAVMNARQALKQLEWVEQQHADIPNLETLISKAIDLATVKVVVEHAPDGRISHRIDSRVFYEQLLEELQESRQNEFVRFYRPEQAEKLKLIPDELVEVKIEEFRVGALRSNEKKESYKADSVVVGTYKDEKGQEHEVLGTVKATARLYHQEIAYSALVKVNVLDYQSSVLVLTKMFPSEMIWHHDWANFNGDERALPKEVMSLIHSKPLTAPSPQDLFLTASGEVYPKVLAHLKSYYKRR